LHGLGFVLNSDVVARTIAEEIPDSVSAVANDNKTMAYAGIAQPFHDMLQHRLAANLDHWLGKFGGKFAHSRAAARGKNDGFVNHHYWISWEARR
jgi:hypothetical protein